MSKFSNLFPSLIVALALSVFNIPSTSFATDGTICASNLAPIECILQRNEQLADVAHEVNDAYEKKLSSLDMSIKSSFIAEQKNWLKSRAPSCGLPKKGSLSSEKITQAISCLLDVYQDRMAGLKQQQCEIDDNHTVIEMATWKDPWSNKVPAEFNVDQRMIAYTIIWKAPKFEMTQSYNLPSKSLSAAKQAGALLKSPYSGLALCRVQDPEGVWWLVQRGRYGVLSYILEADTKLDAETVAP